MSRKELASDLSRRLIQRLNKLGFQLSASSYYVLRTGAGKWGKKAGTWSWSLMQVPLMKPIASPCLRDGMLGGYSPLTATLKAPAISISWSKVTQTWSLDIEAGDKDGVFNALGHDITGKPDEIAAYA